MKPLVPASYAQFGVGAEWKVRNLRACGCRAFPNGMGNPTLLSWRPVHVHRRTPFVVFRPVYGSGWKPASRYKSDSLRACCVQSSLPCVDMANRRPTGNSPAREKSVLLLETLSAKEAKKRFDCSGNHLGCRNGADKGLQCGLSGNRVPQWVTLRQYTERETT